jgi:hypothetical protein
MSRAIVVAFHKYQPYGDKYYQPLFDYFIHRLSTLIDEFDKIYFVDSNWNIPLIELVKKFPIPKFEIIRVDPSLRYYDAYKQVLPQIREDLVLFMDNDMVIYKSGEIQKTFNILTLDQADVVSIYDTIGEKRYPQLNGKSKFCPYWFATRKDILMKYRDCEWGPVPWGETLSELTDRMLKDKLVPFEWEEDKSNLCFDGGEQNSDNTGKGKDLGYYHIRAGSVPAVLLAYKYHDNQKYQDYIKTQPKNEYLRQFAWYLYMLEQTNASLLPDLAGILDDLGVRDQFMDYFKKFKAYHGL